VDTNQTLKMKKILIILILIILIGFAGWVFFSMRSTPQNGDGVSIRDFFPFGRESVEEDLEETPVISTPEEGEEVVGSPQKLPALRKISQSPVAGATVFLQGDETIVRFVDRATGHIFETNAKTPGIQRISNTTIPQIQEAFWVGRNNVILRYLKEDGETIETVSLKLLPPGASLPEVFEFIKNLVQGDSGVDVLNLQRTLNLSLDTRIAEEGPGSPGRETQFFGPATLSAVKKFQEKYASEILDPQNQSEPSGIVDSLTREKLNEITGAKNQTEIISEEESLYQTALTFLPSDISSLTPIDNSGKIFYLQEDLLGSVGVLANPDGSQSERIFESPSHEWLAGQNGNEIIISSKASENFPGLAFFLSTNGAQEKILGDTLGLTVLASPDKNKILYSESQGTGFGFGWYGKSINQKIDLHEVTFPEKCTWSRLDSNVIYCGVPSTIPRGDYPDIWYQGVASFNDFIWTNNLETGNFRSLIDPFGADIINPFLDPTEQFLFFMNKKDYSLWGLKLE